MFIELTDIKLGQGEVGFVFKGYVYQKTQTRFKQKTFAAVKVNFFIIIVIVYDVFKIVLNVFIMFLLIFCCFLNFFVVFLMFFCCFL